MKYLKDFDNYNEGIKSGIAAGLIAANLISCNPGSTTVSSNPVNTEKSIIVDKPLGLNFDIDEDFVSIGTDFHITSDSGSHGIVEQRLVNMSTTFEYLVNDTLISRAEKRIISWGNAIDVYDNNNKLIGSIEEEIIESMFSIRTVYSIKGSKGELLGKSKKLDFIGTDIDIYNNDELIVEMNRAMISLTDSWSISIKSDIIDKRILVFIPCYKTVADKERKEEEDEKKKKEDEEEEDD